MVVKLKNDDGASKKMVGNSKQGSVVEASISAASDFVTFLPYGKFSLLTAVFGVCSSRDRNESSYIKERGYVTHTVVIGQLVFAIPADTPSDNFTPSRPCSCP